MNYLSKLGYALFLILLFFSATALFGDIQVLGSLTRIGSGNPGESYDGSIDLQNVSDETVEVKVYQKDYRFFADGRVLYEETGAHDRTNAPWIEFSPNILAIPAGQGAQVGYRVRIPDSNELIGTYWSLLFIEGVPNDTGEKKDNENFTLSILQVVRYGIQLITEIGDTGSVALDFVNPILDDADGLYTLAIDVENIGSVWLRPEFSCTLFDLSGAELASVDAGDKRLYPGTSTRAVFNLPSLAVGTYRALVLADGGGENLFGANYTLKIED